MEAALDLQLVDTDAMAEASPPVAELKALFALWRVLERQLVRCGKIPPGKGAEDIVLAHIGNQLIAAQSHILGTACMIHAQSFDEVAYKLALWRWDRPDPAQCDRMALSAFEDMIRLTGLGSLADLKSPPAN